MALSRVPKVFSPAQPAEHSDLLAELALAVRAGALTRMGAVTTRSAVLNERLVPKRGLEAMLVLAEQSAPRGWCARNGTLPGLLLDGDEPTTGPAWPPPWRPVRPCPAP